MSTKVEEIIINSILKDVEDKGSLPWQRPYEMFESFNWATKRPYKGINRLILPSGEYVTANQINTYNKTHSEDFKFQKGIKWYPIVFFKTEEIEMTLAKMQKLFSDVDLGGIGNGYIGGNNYWSYFKSDGKFYKSRNILQYYRVAERQHFKNSNGEYLPSRLESGEVVVSYSQPKSVFEGYVEREGISIVETLGSPFYRSSTDTIGVNKYHTSEEEYWCSCFHEAAHSTGHHSRVNREGIVTNKKTKESYAKEECIAEITASLLCNECQISTFSTSESRSYENSLAYINGWKKQIKEWGSSFISIVANADKAFNYIMGIPQ